MTLGNVLHVASDLTVIAHQKRVDDLHTQNTILTSLQPCTELQFIAFSAFSEHVIMLTFAILTSKLARELHAT